MNESCSEGQIKGENYSKLTFGDKIGEFEWFAFCAL